MRTYVLIFEDCLNGRDDLQFEVEAESEKTAIAIYEKSPEIPLGYCLASCRLKWGGARVGAGRKPGHGKYGESTKVVRVPASLAPKIPAILEERDRIKDLLAAWKTEITPKRQSQPRWKYVADLLKELEEVIESTDN